MDDQWDRAIAVEPVEGQPKPPLRTKLDGWAMVLCLFAGIGAELEGLLKVEIEPSRQAHPGVSSALSAPQVPGQVASRRL
jgi:hypothetical protein